MYRLRSLRKLKIHIFSNNFNCYSNGTALSNDILYGFTIPSCNYKQLHENKLVNAFENHALSQVSKHRETSAEVSEKEYLIQIKDDPDTFGGSTNEPQTIDEGDLKEEEYLENPPAPTKLNTKQYADIIKSFIKKRKIKEAIDVLEIKMLKEDKVKPEAYIYNLLLGACGRVGYTKKAFSLYNNLKKRGLKATGGTYTALFNACANSPWKSDGLTRAEHLRNIMIEKQHEPNDTTYNSMIKAFGHCGDLNTAFSICDEMVQKKFLLQDDTLNFLLHACISDKEAGCRHALLLWRQFINKNIAPSIFSYNLMLRCIRDCGLGDIDATKDVINKILSNTLNHNLQLPSPEQTLQSNQIVSNVIGENRPNLMARRPHLGDVLSISEVKTAEDRLTLVGGYSGFLEDMSNNKVAPDIKTFTQLLNCIPSTIASEKELMKAMKKLQIKPDLDFYNMLIKKRSMRFEYENAKEVLTELKEAKFQPDLITYGVLALGCKTKEEAESLLEEMNKASYRLNIEILGAMLHQACHHNNFPYILFLMDTCLNNEIRPSKKFIEMLDEFKKKCKKRKYDDATAKTKSFQKGFEIFKMRCSEFLKANPINEDEIHPWQQFREPTNTDVKHFKDTEARFKPRHTSLYKQKLQKNKIVRR